MKLDLAPRHPHFARTIHFCTFLFCESVGSDVCVEEHQVTWGRSLKEFYSAGKIGSMNLQLMTIGVQKIQRFAFAMVLLPDLHCRGFDPLYERSEVALANSKGDMIVGRAKRSRYIALQRKTDPHITCKEVSPSIPTCNRFQSKHSPIKIERTIQVGYRKRDVIEPRNHRYKVTPI